MKKLVMVTTMVLASISQADTLKCYFTEPFINSSYDTSKETLSYNSISAKKKMKKVSLQIKDEGVIELIDKDGKVLQTLTLDKQGSDGMSDIVYPYSVKDNNSELTGNPGIGGCESDALKRVEPAE